MSEPRERTPSRRWPERARCGTLARVSTLQLRSLTPGPRLDHLLALPDGVARRTVHTGVLEVGTPTIEGPGRREGLLSTFLPDGFDYAPDLEQRGGVALALVSPRALLPLSDTDARCNLLGVRARFAPTNEGHLRVVLEVFLEALYVTQRSSLQLSYQVEVFAPR